MSGRYPYQKLARKLKYRILRGYYKPGTLLPAIRTLAEQEGYNPATVRRSLEILKQEGLVVCKGTLGFWINVLTLKESVLRKFLCFIISYIQIFLP